MANTETVDISGFNTLQVKNKRWDDVNGSGRTGGGRGGGRAVHAVHLEVQVLLRVVHACDEEMEGEKEREWCRRDRRKG